ncbi:MAG: hypothetical protein LBE74_03415 [Treponema sp.]|nr:hypothetical protein [Treponema sp.]
MQKNVVKIGVALLAALLVSFFSACTDGGDDKQNSAATLSSVTVAGISLAAVPTSIPSSDWNDEEFLLSSLGAEHTAQVTVKTADDLTNAEVIANASAGAKLAYAVGTVGSTKPSTFSDAATVTLATNNYLYIRVTSEDGKNVNYYRIQVTTESANANLNGIALGEVQVTALGTPAATYNAETLVAGMAALTNAQKNGVTVTATPSFSGATVKYAKASGDAAPTFADSLTTDFTDGDFLYVEVTAQNGVDKNVYKVEIQIGRNASLTGISFDETPVFNFGIPSATAADVFAGGFLFATQTAKNIAVTATPADSQATVKYAKASGDAAPTFAESLTTDFTDGDFVYIEVTAANETTKLYYKIQVNLQLTATIKYGTPDIEQKGEDSIWADLPVYNINKVFPSDSTAAYLANPDTSGVAKALFDENGLWVYVEVTDPAIHSAAATANQHLYDSVELFINENADAKNAGYATQGGQYRLGALDEVSGDPTAAVTAFNALNKHTAWKTSTGYAVIFQAPWRFKDAYPITDGKLIGFELQINACTGNGARDGVMVWNNIAHSNYQNASDYGEATLDADGHTFTTDAQIPNISGQPSSVTYDISGEKAAPTLTVTAAVTDGGTLTYQWYSNTANSATNATMIPTATNTTYTPPVTTEGTTYYYAVVTNTNDDVDGEKVKTATSAIAKVEVVDYAGAELVDRVTLWNGGVVVYQFTLPEGSTWSDYTKITADYLVDEENFSKSYANYRIYGPYASTLFAKEGDHYLVTLGSDTNAPYIFHQDANSTPTSFGGTAGAWFTVTVEFDSANPNGSFTHAPEATDTGPFYFGLGLKPANGIDSNVTFYVKNVTLSNADGSKEVVAADSGFDAPAFVGYGGSAFASEKAPDPAPTAE